MKVLITGGAGYIGSTIATALIEAGHAPVLLDSLVRGRREFAAGLPLYEGDVGDPQLVRRVFSEHPDIACTVHCAALAVVGESVSDPISYYQSNVTSSLRLFETLLEVGRPSVIFSSSASVYAPNETFEVTEESPLAPASPYAWTKLMTEQMLTDVAAATPLRALSLRYFNPVGADPSGRTGPYDPRPTHVLGRMLAVAQGDLPEFVITGTDLPTPDGTGIRDYLHVWDLARAHVAAVERFDAVLEAEDSPSAVLNLGTGSGVSVRELVDTFERVSGRPLPVREGPPRPGDAVGAYANVDKAHTLLGWRAASSLDDALRSAIEWTGRWRAATSA